MFNPDIFQADIYGVFVVLINKIILPIVGAIIPIRLLGVLFRRPRE